MKILSKEEAKLDWNKPAKQLWQEVRAFNPWPVSYFEHQQSSIKVWQVRYDTSLNTATPGTITQADKNGIVIATASVSLIIDTMQLPNKKPLAVADILNSRADWFSVGTLLSQEAN